MIGDDMLALLAQIEGSSTLFGIAAVVSSLGGIALGIIGIRKTRRDERDKVTEDCLQRLREARAEAETLAAALHELRMKQYDKQSRIDAEEILERWSHLE